MNDLKRSVVFGFALIFSACGGEIQVRTLLKNFLKPRAPCKPTLWATV